MTAAVERVEDALRSRGGKPSKGKANCLAHDDQNASLTYKQGDNGGAVVHCHAGCTAEAVVAALGLTMRDLMGDQAAWAYRDQAGTVLGRPAGIFGTCAGGRLSTVWTYRDQAGAVLGHVARYDGPKGKVIRPYFQRDGDGWKSAHAAKPRPLFGLDVLARNPAALVWVVEGEKCAASLHRLGAAAVTSSGGADSAKHADWSPLRGRRVRIWPDNDDPGQKYAAAVGTLAREAGAESVETVDVGQLGLPAKGDCVDWLKAHPGATLADVEALPLVDGDQADSNPVVVVCSAADLRTRTFRDPKVILAGLLTEGLYLLAGAPKLGKSWLALLVALAKALGGSALGTSTNAGAVAFFGLEDGLKRLQRRLRMMTVAGEAWPDNLLLADGQSFPWRGAEAVDHLARFHDQNPAVELIVLDTLHRLRPETSGRASAYDLDVAFAAPFQRLAIEREICILGLAHTRKRDRRYNELDGLESVSGTLGLPGCADGVLVLQRGRLAAEGELLITGRDLPERKIALRFDSTCGLWTYQGEAEQVAVTKERAEIVAAMRQHGQPMTVKEIAAATGRKYDPTKYLVLKLVGQGTLARFSTGQFVLSPLADTPSSPSCTSCTPPPSCTSCEEEEGRKWVGTAAPSCETARSERASQATGRGGRGGSEDCRNAVNEARDHEIAHQATCQTCRDGVSPCHEAGRLAALVVGAWGPS